ncbi:cob(I)yrinic acid a,c-diamide adenosyltransferase [Prevotella sp. KH2C16]|uniref:cob(I)yrinic acid a,c-diamide adenosyltransferase n=1 Tax=Prevotella sp. KH2C16 TaxID=1855325 RepID=UPI0008EF0BE3|nr:cob(I)yrinic acid a,c-diamide adenosyltransferase [Prevotella sp. KH2C16]SFG20577.1 ATP:cob(I)alamin adenosyltransferase [Prevotella sp. KH2C16]
MKIYTKKGDDGQTAIGRGDRVSKTDIRIEANGEIDELNALLGVVRTLLPEEDKDALIIKEIQLVLMRVMGHVVMPDSVSPEGLETLTQRMEARIDALASAAPFGFVVPGSSRQEAFLHVARTKARTAERRLWAVREWWPIADEVMKFMNRLSDYLFAVAEKETF